MAGLRSGGLTFHHFYSLHVSRIEALRLSRERFRVCNVQDMHNELQDVMGQSFGVPDDIDEDDLMGELDALEDELAQEAENPSASGVPSYLQVTHHPFSTLPCLDIHHPLPL